MRLRIGLVSLMAGLLLCLLPGCGVGILIGGAVAGILAASDSGSSGGPPVRPAASLDPPPDRQSLRELGNASVVPVCYALGGADEGSVVVQFARGAEDFARWRQATRCACAPAAAPCGGARTFWWDARADLDLAPGTSERARVRVLSSAKSVASPASGPFHVGNSPPRVEWLPISDDGGDITLIFSAQDAEGDPLEDLRLAHELREGPPAVPCGAPPAGERDAPWTAPRRADRFPAPGEMEMVLRPPLPPRLEAPASGVDHSATWDSRQATGDHDVQGLELHLRCRDAFGETLEATTALDIHNNHPPEARLIGGALALADRSFEVPVPFELLDADGHAVDIVVQYAMGREPFPPLPPDLAVAARRRAVLGDPGAEDLRRELRIATPARSELAGSRVCGLAAGAGSGERHFFLWDSLHDLGYGGTDSVRLRITPFDESPGRADESSGALVIENDLFAAAISLGADGGAVGGTALGDLDGDERLDAVISLATAPTWPGDETRRDQKGRVDIHLRAADGSFRSLPLSLVPGRVVPAGTARGYGPLDVETVDLDADGALDLIVLVSNCPPGSCNDVRGQVAIFFGPVSAGAEPVVLDAGGDVRALCVGDFDGTGGLDIAVSNHDPTSTEAGRLQRGVGVFLQGPSRVFADMVSHHDCDASGCVEPGLIACGDFSGDGLDDLAVRQRLENRVRILEWDRAAGELVPTALVTLPGDPPFTPVSLAAVRWDGDDLADLVIGSRDRAAVYLFLNRGGGRFEEVASACLRASPEKILLAQLVGDGRPEIIAFEQNQVAQPDILGGLLEPVELAGDGDCCAAPCALQGIAVDILPGDAFPPPRFAAGDADGNGTSDLLVGSEAGARLFLAGAPGSLELGARSTIELHGRGTLVDIALADANGDGLRDVVAASSLAADDGTGSNQVLLFYQDLLGGFPQVPSRVLAGAGDCGFRMSGRLAILDLDGDASCDLLGLSRLGGVDVFLREEAELPESPSGSLSDCVRPLAAGPILFGELDGAPGVDLLRFDSFGGRLLLSTLETSRGEQGALSVRLVERSTVATDQLAQSLPPGDFNGDGREDVALHFANTGKVAIFTQAPGGAPAPFEEQPVARLEPGAGKVYPADLDDDGSLDVLVVSETHGRILGFYQEAPAGGGPLAFRPAIAIELAAGETPRDAVVDDLNGDGRRDVAVVVAGEDRARVYYQRPGGGFLQHASWLVDLGPELEGAAQLVAADVSGDSRPDLVALGANGTRLVIVRSR